MDALLAEPRPYRKTFVVVTVAVIAAGFAWLLLTPDRYVSTARLMVSLEGATTATAYQNDEVVSGRVNSYVALLTSEVVSNLAVDALALPMSARELAGEVSAAVVPPKTSLIDVAVTDRDPAQARLLADTVTREFVRYVDVLETPTGEDDQKVNATIVSAASEPRQPWTERAGLAAAVLLLGPLLGAVAVWVRARTDSVVRTAHRAAIVSGVPVLARVEDTGTPADGDLDGYRRLRMRLHSLPRLRAGPEDPSAVWVLTSPGGEADTAVVASNLERVMVAAGDRAIAVGYDESGIRKLSPRQEHRPVPVPRELSASFPVDESGGPAADPAAVIDGARTGGTCVLVAVGPVLHTSAAPIVGGNADGILLVVPAETRRRDLARAVGSLRDGGVCPVGVVFVDRSGAD